MSKHRPYAHPPRKGLALALALGLVAPGTGAWAAGEGASADVLVFDASGSMWGQLEGGENKISVAREVMSDFFSRRDDSHPLAVIAYGHRRRGDCKDIEVLAASGRHDASRLSAQLAAINPRGMTPIAASLRAAAKQIPRTAERSNIILVTDGLETCDANPCEAAAELAASGHEIRAHVVGFGLTEKEASALSCISDQTGGKLLRPQSGEELAAALEQIATAVPEPAAPANFFDVGPKAEAGHTYRISYQGTARNDDYAGFTLRGEGAPHVSPSFNTIGGGKVGNNPFSVRAPLEPGQYDLIMVASGTGEITSRQAIEVVPASNGFDAIGSVEPGKRFRFTWRGPDQVNERVVIARPGDAPGTYQGDWGYAMTAKGKMSLAAPKEPGMYELRYLSANRKEVLFHRAFGVGVPYQDQDQTSSAELARKAAAATQAEPDQDSLPMVRVLFRIPANFPKTPVWWSAVPLDPGPTPDAWALPDAAVVGQGLLEPGRYVVTAVGPGEVEFRKTVEIVPGQKNEFVLDLVDEPDGDVEPTPDATPAAATRSAAPASSASAAMRALRGVPVKSEALGRDQINELLSKPEEN